MRVLVFEPDGTQSEALLELLNAHSYQCDSAESLEDAKYFLDVRNYDLVLVGWDAKENGTILGLIGDIKKNAHKTAVIVLSDRQERESEIEALKAGADDFIRKPVDEDILLVRMEAKLRFGASNIIEIEDLVINPEEEKIIYQGKEIELKGKPFEVLTHLAIHKDQIVSKEQLLDAIWEEPELVTPNVIEVAINQIRQKMDKPLGITTIETVRRRGYRFCFPKTPA
jgi:two-component system OmpR family response regulator